MNEGQATGLAIRIVTPVYLDTDAFLLLRSRVTAAAAPLEPRDLRFVVVDDSAGTDPEIERLLELPDVTVIDPPFNLGHQRAIVFALRRIAAELDDDEIVVTMDADGEDQPDDLPRLIEPLTAADTSRHHISLALRTARRETRTFKFAYAAFKLLFRGLTGEVVRSGNYAAYRGWLAKQVIGHPYFDMSYSATLISLQLPRVMVPCERGARYAGQSSMNVGRLVMHGLSMLMPFTDRIAVRALASFTVTIALSAVAAFAVLAVRLFTESAVPGWATYTLLFLLTLSFIALGNFVVLFAVFSQTRAMSFAHLHDTVDNRPRRAFNAAG
jgi:hypothetical protein